VSDEHSLSVERRRTDKSAQKKKASERVMGAYQLPSIDGGISPHSEETSDGYSLSVECNGRDKSAQQMQVREP
jgi:hypothetical protein